MQNLHRFQSQLQLYPIKVVSDPASSAMSDVAEILHQEDPMFGVLAEDQDFGSGYLTQVSSSDAPNDEFLQSHQKKVTLSIQ